MRRRIEPPTWGAPGTKPRIVIENADPAERWVEDRILADAGYEVVTCAGPDTPRTGPCPLVVGADCPGIAGADVVVSSLRVEKDAGRAVLAGIRKRYPDMPIIVDAPPAAVADHAAALEGCQVVFPLTSVTLLEAVDTALGRTAVAG
jgi:DNA-binding NtrC family response regulator